MKKGPVLEWSGHRAVIRFPAESIGEIAQSVLDMAPEVLKPGTVGLIFELSQVRLLMTAVAGSMAVLIQQAGDAGIPVHCVATPPGIRRVLERIGFVPPRVHYAATLTDVAEPS